MWKPLSKCENHLYTFVFQRACSLYAFGIPPVQSFSQQKEQDFTAASFFMSLQFLSFTRATPLTKTITKSAHDVIWQTESGAPCTTFLRKHPLLLVYSSGLHDSGYSCPISLIRKISTNLPIFQQLKLEKFNIQNDLYPNKIELRLKFKLSKYMNQIHFFFSGNT